MLPGGSRKPHALRLTRCPYEECTKGMDEGHDRLTVVPVTGPGEEGYRGHAYQLDRRQSWVQVPGER